jgi:hypothetical protein
MSRVGVRTRVRPSTIQEEEKCRKDNGLFVFSNELIPLMKRLVVFRVTQLLEHVANSSSVGVKSIRRRVNDVVSILMGAGCIEKMNSPSTLYKWIGIGTEQKGVLSLCRAFRQEKAPLLYGNINKRSRYLGWRVLQLLSLKEEWHITEFNRELIDHRRIYDVLAIFLAAGIIEGEKKLFRLTNNLKHTPSISVVKKSAPPPRLILKVSNEDAIAVWPELVEHLKQVNKEDFFTF